MKKLLIACAFLMWLTPAFAKDGFVDISVTGMQQKDNYKDGAAVETKSTLGVELGIPITDYFQISFGYTYYEEKMSYNDESSARARESVAINTCTSGTTSDKTECATEIMNGKKFTSVLTKSDITANTSFGYPIGLFYPSVFFGKLWRKTQEKNSVTTEKEVPNSTWNAGLAAQMYLTYRLRFKVSYRLSPSVNFSSSNREFDTLTSLGFTYSL